MKFEEFLGDRNKEDFDEFELDKIRKVVYENDGSTFLYTNKKKHYIKIVFRTGDIRKLFLIKEKTGFTLEIDGNKKFYRKLDDLIEFIEDET